MKERRKNEQFLNERREDEIKNVNEATDENQPVPQPKDFEEIEY